LSQHADDRDVNFTLGLMAKQQGHYGQAEEYYRRVIQLAPSWNEGYTHLGNVYFARKQTEQAVAAYQQAIELNPNQAATYFNLYRAYAQETFLSSKIDRAFQKARQLDPQLVDAYTSIDHPPHANRLVIDLPLSATVFWGRFYHQFIGREGLLFRLFKTWFEWIPSRLSFLTPLVFLFFLIVMSKVTRNKRYVTRCPMCGNPTYRFYLGQEEKEYLCFNCYRISVQKEKFHSKITDRKAHQIREFKQTNHRVGRVISFLLLGFQDLWEDRPVKGFVLLVLFFFFLLRIVHWNGVIPYPGVFYPSSLGGGIVWSGCFVLFYFLMLWRKRKAQAGSHPREERTGKP
jgi:hypothetical protein